MLRAEQIWISIHALREEGDRYPTVSNMIQVDFYPRPPRGGRREGPSACVCVLEFLSTPSARRATQGGEDLSIPGFISIHALREEGDDNQLDGVAVLDISIHALREEGDPAAASSIPSTTDFYPRPPRGGRPSHSRQRQHRQRFLSTPSARRATRRRGLPADREAISIHALREEGDCRCR